MRLTLVAAVLLVSGACSHAPPAAETAKAERRDDWLLALKSDLDLMGSNDGFEGRVRVLHAGKAEVDKSFGDPACLPIGAGRKPLAAVAVGLLVEGGKLGWEDRLEQRLPRTAGSSFAPLTVANLLTSSAGLAPTTGDTVEQRLEAAGKVPLQGRPGTRIDPGDDRPWVLLEQVVAEASGAPFDRFVAERILDPAGMSGTSLVATSSCPDAVRGTTTLEDQFRFIDALRAGKLVSPAMRNTLWEPRVSLGPGFDVGYGFFVRTQGDDRAVGVSAEGTATAYELWLDPTGTDALVLLGRTPVKTARSIRTALGEFYALPPRPPQAPAPVKRR